MEAERKEGNEEDAEKIYEDIRSRLEDIEVYGKGGAAKETKQGNSKGI